MSKTKWQVRNDAAALLRASKVKANKKRYKRALARVRSKFVAAGFVLNNTAGSLEP